MTDPSRTFASSACLIRLARSLGSYCTRFDVVVLGVFVVDEDVHLVHASEEVVHVAHDVLVGARQEHSQVVRLPLAERMQRDGLVDGLVLDEAVDLPVGVASDVDDGRVAGGNLVETMQRDDGKQLIDCPMVWRALEDREVRHVLIGEPVFQAARLTGHALAPFVDADQLAAQAPEEPLDDRALLQAEDAQLEHRQRLFLLGDGVVVGLT